jgi:hypothetical protein
VYQLTFLQLGACSHTLFAPRWFVTLGNITEREPANYAFNGYVLGPGPVLPIVFSVGNGTYHYKLGPSPLFEPDSGVVNVNGSDVTVQLSGYGTSCTLTRTTSSNS